MDDLLMNDGAAFNITTPEEQVVEENSEKSKVLAALPILKELVERWRLKVQLYESVKAIPDEVLSDETLFMHTVAANKQTIPNLLEEIDYLEGLISTYETK